MEKYKNSCFGALSKINVDIFKFKKKPNKQTSKKTTKVIS